MHTMRAAVVVVCVVLLASTEAMPMKEHAPTELGAAKAPVNGAAVQSVEAKVRAMRNSAVKPAAWSQVKADEAQARVSSNRAAGPRVSATKLAEDLAAVANMQNSKSTKTASPGVVAAKAPAEVKPVFPKNDKLAQAARMEDKIKAMRKPTAPASWTAVQQVEKKMHVKPGHKENDQMSDLGSTSDSPPQATAKAAPKPANKAAPPKDAAKTPKPAKSTSNAIHVETAAEIESAVTALANILPPAKQTPMPVAKPYQTTDLALQQDESKIRAAWAKKPMSQVKVEYAKAVKAAQIGMRKKAPPSKPKPVAPAEKVHIVPLPTL